MSYQVYVTKDLPYAFYSADAIAGGRVVAPLVRGIGNASAIETGDTATFAFPGFVQSRRDQAFALEAWFLPLGGSAQILGHAEGDGIMWNGTDIVFRLKLTGESVDVIYTPEQIQTFHVVAQYSRQTMVLYANGELVSSYTLTDAQQAQALTTFAAESTLVSTGNHIIDAVAVYTSDVAAQMAKRHYEQGSYTDSMMLLTSSFGGAMYEHANFQPTVNYTWADEAWGWKNFADISLDSEGMYATEDGTTWRDNVMIDSNVDSIYLDWKGKGNYTVLYSIDGAAWTAATRLTKIVTTSVQDLAVEILFANSLARVSRLQVISATDVYLNETPIERPAKVAFASAPDMFYPINNKKFGGARGTITFEPSLTTNTYAVEFWVKPDSSSTVGATTTFVGTSYVNGVAGTALPAGEWSHVFINLTTPENVSRQIAGVGRWACPALYPNTLTAPQVIDLYNSYYGKDTHRVLSSGFMTISDALIQDYAYDWTLSSAT